MDQSLRNSGNEILGAIPWGTHLCHLYETKQDLLDIILPYFAAGLKDNEVCLWITSDPVGPLEAEKALSALVPDLAECKRRGQMMIVPCDQWYSGLGSFDGIQALKLFMEKEGWALANGYAGLRVSANASSLDAQGWDALLDYERAADSVIGDHRAMALCCYPLKDCSLPSLVEVIDTHESALIRERGVWRRIVGGRRKMEVSFCEKESMLNVFFDQVNDSILLLEIPPEGEPVIRDLNTIALKNFGYTREELVGKPVSFLNEDAEDARSITNKGRGGAGISFVVRHKRKNGSVFVAEAAGREMVIGGKLMAISVERDITERLKASEALKKTCAALEIEKRRLEEKNIAFREAMSAIEAEKNKMKDEIIINVNKIILPILKRIRLGRGASRKPLDLLEKNLETLTSSFGRRLTEKSLKLTPKEIEISNMVKAGLSTKEIAGVMNASLQTVDKHRNNIRRKLGLTNKSVNLVTYLQSL